MSEQVKLEPGRELDALVAERVMGWDTSWDTDWDNPLNGEPCVLVDIPYHRYFMPSTRISAAWEVVEKIQREYGPIHIKDRCWEFGYDAPIYWRVWLEGIGPEHEAYVDADTAPHAICLAALKAVEAT